MMHNSSGSDNESIRILKKELRHKLTETRRSISEELRSGMDLKILEGITGTEEYDRCGIVLTYASYNGEADTYGLIRRCILDGKKVACPVCAFTNGEPLLDFYLIDSIDDLKKGYRGIPEPPDDRSKRVDDDEILGALIVVPMVGYDKTGNRLGYGGGFYDRFLAYHRYLSAVGIAYSCQEHEGLPTDRYDCRPDMIINENTVIRIRERIR